MKKGLWILVMALTVGLMLFGCVGDDDGADTDPGTDPDTVCEVQEDWMGEACSSNSFCQELACDQEAFCYSQGGFCTQGCTPADAESPSKDGCGVTNAVCAPPVYNVPGLPENICVQPCTPGRNYNPCDNQTLTCHPEYGYSFEALTPTCQMFACNVDADCAAIGLVSTGDPCQVNGDCEEGGVCDPTNLVCTYSKDCDPLTGRCVFHNDDKPDVQIGDPCKTDLDCGTAMECEADDSTFHFFPNGYCTKRGCMATLPSLPSGTNAFYQKDEFDCGDEASCYVAPTFGGLCMRKCDPNRTVGDEKGCRQTVWDADTDTELVLDAPGDYECYTAVYRNYGYPYVIGGGTQNPQTGFVEYATDSLCMSSRWVGGCDAIADLEDATCANLFGKTEFDTDMICRDVETGDPVTEGGYCLDSTTSGPAGDWLVFPVDTDTIP